METEVSHLSRDHLDDAKRVQVEMRMALEDVDHGTDSDHGNISVKHLSKDRLDDWQLPSPTSQRGNGNIGTHERDGS